MNGSYRGPVLGAILYAVLMLSLLTPLMILTFSFIMIPVIFLFVRHSPKMFAASYGAAVAAVLLIAGPYGWILVAASLFYLLPSLVMGRLYKKGSPARTVLAGGVIAMIGQLVLTLLITTTGGFNPVGLMEQFMRESVDALPEIWRSQISEDLLAQTVGLMVKMLPFYMIVFSCYFVFISHWISRRLLNRFGGQIPGLPPIKRWMLPRSLIWYYFIGLLLWLFVPGDSSSVLSTVLWNLIPLLMIVFSVQGIGFLFYVADYKKWNRLLPIAAIILLLIMPPVHYLISLLGVMDVAFPIRKRLRGR